MNFNTGITSGVKLVLSIVISLTLFGCAAQEEVTTGIPSGGNDCFLANTIQDWKALDDRTLIVWAPSRRHAYRVDLIQRCNDLRFSEKIGFQDRDGRICPFGGDTIPGRQKNAAALHQLNV